MKKNENNLNTTVEKLKEELSSVRKEFKEMSKYVKNMLRPDEEEEKEIQKCEFIREKAFNQKEEENMIKEKNTPNEKYISPNVFMIYIYLYEDKIKIRINEIQDNLKSNPSVYESIFMMNDFEKISEYYIQYRDIEIIYNFLCELFEKRKDTLEKKGDEKIILIDSLMFFKFVFRLSSLFNISKSILSSFSPQGKVRFNTTLVSSILSKTSFLFLNKSHKKSYIAFISVYLI